MPCHPGGRRDGGSESSGAFDYAQEDQSAVGKIRTGMRVRHKQFGVGTILDVEDQGDDTKVTIRFLSVGTKKLLVRYA